MTEFLIRHFIKDSGQPGDPRVRGRYGLLSSLVGICCNAALFLCKFLIGTVSGSVSIMADSVNNLSDAGSSVVTLIGFRISGRPADEGHPFGHARAEYIGGLIVSFMILLLGVEFLRSSFLKILHPEPVTISALALFLLLLSVLLKVWMGLFNRRVGKRIDSAALLATAQDSFNDVITTSVVLLAAALAKFTGLQIDGYMGVAVALFILYSGLGLARETVSPLLGQAPDPGMVQALEKKITSYEEVLGVHDLVVHSYGPGNWYASVHAEVSAKEDILKSHDVIDNIEREVLAGMGVHLVIHLDPVVTDDPAINELREFVRGKLRAIDPALSMHDFRVVFGETHTNLIFDVVVPVGFRQSDHQLGEQIQRAVGELDPGYYYTVVTFDRSYTSATGC